MSQNAQEVPSLLESPGSFSKNVIAKSLGLLGTRQGAAEGAAKAGSAPAGPLGGEGEGAERRDGWGLEWLCR